MASLSSYTVIAPHGMPFAGDYFQPGAILYLSDAQAKYLVLARQIAPSVTVAPPTTPTPIPVTESNTTFELTVSGVKRVVTVAEFINYFPSLRGATGPVGPTGPQGEVSKSYVDAAIAALQAQINSGVSAPSSDLSTETYLSLGLL